MASKVELELVALTRKAGGDIDKFASGASTVMKTLGAVAAGALAVFASRKLISQISKVTAAASIQEDAINSLNSALKLSGDFSIGASEDLQRFASDLQSVTTIGDETTLKMLALAKSFGVGNSQAKKLVSAAADLAEATGVSLENAVDQLGKTYSGSIGLMGRQLPVLKELTQEQLASGAAIDIVAKRFKGAASAATQTYSGSMKQLSNAFGDLQEELGFIITKNPQILAFLQSLKEGFEELSQFVSDNRQAISDLISDGIIKLTNSVPKAVRAVAGMSEIIVDFGIAVNATHGGLLVLYNSILQDSGRVAAALKLITSPIDSIVFGIAEINKEIKRSQLKELEKQLDAVNRTLAGKNGLFDNLLNFGATQPFDTSREAVAKLEKGISDLKGEIALMAGVSQIAVDEITANSIESQKAIADQLSESLKRDEFLQDLKLKLQLDSNDLKPLEDILDKITNAFVAGPARKGFDPMPEGGPLAEISKSGAGGDFDILSSSILQNLSDAPVKTAGDIFAERIVNRAKDFGSAVGLSILGNITKGKAGGQAVLGAAATAGATAFGLPPQIAGPLGSIVTDLAGATKEEAEQMARDFALGITEGIKALVENAPAFITALAENSGEIITAIIAAIPDITMAFIKAQPQIAQALVMELVNGIKFQIGELGPKFKEFGSNFSEEFNIASQKLIKGVTNFPSDFAREGKKAISDFTGGIGKAFNKLFASDSMLKNISDTFVNAAKSFVGELVAKAKEVVESLTPKVPKLGGGGGGGGGRGPITGIKGSPLATGGLVKGFGVKDTVPAMLTPGELVIDRTTGPRLNRFLDSAEGGGGSNDVLLSRILALLESPMTVQSEVRLDNRVLADIILQLNRSGARLTA